MMDEFLIEKPDEESELLWLIQQCQDGIPQAVEGLVNRYDDSKRLGQWLSNDIHRVLTIRKSCVIIRNTVTVCRIIWGRN